MDNVGQCWMNLGIVVHLGRSNFGIFEILNTFCTFRKINILEILGIPPQHTSTDSHSCTRPLAYLRCVRYSGLLLVSLGFFMCHISLVKSLSTICLQPRDLFLNSSNYGLEIGNILGRWLAIFLGI